MTTDGLGIVETQYYTCYESPNELLLKSGEKLGSITIAYETYGELNKDKSNAVLVCHALTGDAHAAGWHEGDKKPGWWDSMIGPGKALDTNKYFIICTNVLGSCKGTTGPASINPATGKPYGLGFPVITIPDMISVQKRLLDYFNIDQLLCVAGGSMGGMQTLQWTIQYPDMMQSAIVIATNTKHTALQIAFHEVARQSIMSDPDWKNGNYYGECIPARGLAIGRMIGHITYMSEESMESKFGRRLFSKEKLGYDFSTDFEVESYLKYRGDSFVERFDANSWLYLSKSLDYFNLAEGKSSITEALEIAKAKFLVISFTSDWLYPSYQTKKIPKALKANDIEVSDIEIKSSYGHDAFLIEVKGQSNIISHFLENVKKDQ